MISSPIESSVQVKQTLAKATTSSTTTTTTNSFGSNMKIKIKLMKLKMKKRNFKLNIEFNLKKSKKSRFNTDKRNTIELKDTTIDISESEKFDLDCQLDLYSSGSYSNNNTTSYRRRATHQRKRQRLNEKRFLSSTIDENSFDNENRLRIYSASVSKDDEVNRKQLKKQKILGDSAATQLRTFDVNFNNFYNYYGNSTSEHVILEKFQEFGEFKVWYV